MENIPERLAMANLIIFCRAKNLVCQVVWQGLIFPAPRPVLETGSFSH